jgi:multidrug efflux system outer membrane protein
MAQECKSMSELVKHPRAAFGVTPSRGHIVRSGKASPADALDRASSRSLRLVLTALSVAVLSACSMIPKYERPAAPVAAQFPGPAPAATPGAAPAADIAWKEFVGDARLRDLIALALTNNRDLRVATLNI